MNPFDFTGYQVLWTLIRMMADLRLTHFHADLSHENSMQFTCQLARLIVLSETFFGRSVFALHVVNDFIECTLMVFAFCVLAAILTTILLGLVSRSDWRSVSIALHAERRKRNVRICHLAIATQIYTPQIWPQRILRHGPVTRLANQISGIAIPTVPHIERAFQ